MVALVQLIFQYAFSVCWKIQPNESIWFVWLQFNSNHSMEKTTYKLGQFFAQNFSYKKRREKIHSIQKLLWRRLISYRFSKFFQDPMKIHSPNAANFRFPPHSPWPTYSYRSYRMMPTVYVQRVHFINSNVDYLPNTPYKHLWIAQLHIQRMCLLTARVTTATTK